MRREDVFIEIDNVTKHFKIAADAVVRAVDGVSFTVNRDETLAIVGESGSGKSTLGRLMIRLMEPTSGRIVIDGNDVSRIPDRKLKATRRRVQMVFQDPYSSLDPRMSVAETLGEALAIHGLAAGLRGPLGLAPQHLLRLLRPGPDGPRQARRAREREAAR